MVKTEGTDSKRRKKTATETVDAGVLYAQQNVRVTRSNASKNQDQLEKCLTVKRRRHTPKTALKSELVYVAADDDITKGTKGVASNTPKLTAAIRCIQRKDASSPIRDKLPKHERVDGNINTGDQGMSKLEAARQGVVKLAREGAEAESAAELKAEVEKHKDLLEGWSSKYAGLAKEKDEVAAELTRVREELKVSEDKVADSEQARVQAEADHAAELGKLKQQVEELQKQVADQAAVETESGLDELICSQYDAGCFHILRLYQASVRPEDRLTVDQMLEWKNAHIFRQDLRVFHPEIPYTERDLEMFAQDQLSNNEKPWVAPQVAPRNLLDLVREYDNFELGPDGDIFVEGADTSRLQADASSSLAPS